MFQFNMNIFVIGAKLTEQFSGLEMNISKNKKRILFKTQHFEKKNTVPLIFGTKKRNLASCQICV